MASKKQANPLFVAIYNTKWDIHFANGQIWKGYWNSNVWKQLFSGSMSINLPCTTVEQHRTVTSSDGKITVNLKLRPSGPKGCRKHRVFTKCVYCGNDVQAGRIAQHRC